MGEAADGPAPPPQDPTDPHRVDRPRSLLLLRHGRTEWNLLGRAQGQADVPLDAVGREQADEVAPRVAALEPVALWASDLSRAAQTAEPVARVTGLPVVHDARLREFSVGEREGLTWEESVQRFPWIASGVGLSERLSGVPGAEDDDAVAARIGPAMEDLLASLDPGQTAVAVSHGAAIKVALTVLLGWERRFTKSLAVLENCRWAAVEDTGAGLPRRLLGYGLGAAGGRFALDGGIG